MEPTKREKILKKVEFLDEQMGEAQLELYDLPSQGYGWQQEKALNEKRKALLKKMKRIEKALVTARKALQEN